MPRDMFGDVANPSISVGTKKWYAVPPSIVTHVAVLGVLVVPIEVIMAVTVTFTLRLLSR